MGFVAGGAGALALFVRECGRRSKQLTRIEKELNAEFLSLRLPTNALADMPYGQPVTLKSLRLQANQPSGIPPRLLAVCGTAAQLRQTLQPLSVLGRRLVQSSAYVVPIATDGSKPDDWGITKSDKSVGWLAEAQEPENWVVYFNELSPQSSEFRWFGLNSNGRSFGSGAGEFPEWLQVLGQHLRPTDVLDESDKSFVAGNAELESVVKAQTTFYKALTLGDMESMNSIYCKDKANEVSQVSSILFWIMSFH